MLIFTLICFQIFIIGNEGFSLSNKIDNNNLKLNSRPKLAIKDYKDLVNTEFVFRYSVFEDIEELEKIDLENLYFYDNIYNYGQKFLMSSNRSEWRFKTTHERKYEISDTFILNYFRNKIIDPEGYSIYYKFAEVSEKIPKLNFKFYNHLEEYCSEAYIGGDCRISSDCTNIQRVYIVNGVSLCYGHTITKGKEWYFYNTTVQYLKQTDTFLKYLDNFDLILIFQNRIQIFFPIKLLHFDDYFRVDIRFNGVFVKLKFLDLEYLGKQFEKQSLIGFVPIKYRYKYVCDDSLYKNLRMVDDIYIYPSSRGACNKYIYYNNSHYLCFDLLFTSHEICPKDYFISNTQFNKIFDVNKFYILPVKNNTDKYIGYINYYIESFYTKFLENYNILKIEIFKFWSDLYERFSNNITKFFDYKIIIDYLINKQNINIDYFIQKLSSKNITIDYDKNLYGNWISDIFGVLIKPFTEAFLAILKEFWEFLREPLIEILNIFLDILIDVLLDFEKLLNKILIAIEPKLILLIELLVKLFIIIQKLIITLYVQIDNEFILTEYIVLYIIILYLLKNTVASTLLLLLIILVFGLNRHFCSILLTIINDEYKINKTDLFICNFSSVLENYTYNESWFNFKELDFLFDLLEIN